MVDSDDEEDLALQQAIEEMERKRSGGRPPPASGSSGPPQRPSPGPPSRGPPSGRGQPPPKHSTPSKAAPPPPPQQKEEDELSEVEMLSISSDDEAPPARSPPVVQTRRDIPPPKSSKGVEVDDFTDDEDDVDVEDNEPKAWKHVNEAELVRRVREMRESRAAPPGEPALRRRQSTAGEGLQELRDPLGLGPLDLNNLHLGPLEEASGVRGSGRRRGEESAAEARMREKLLYTGESFDALLYLTRVHRESTLAQLEGGEAALRRDLQSGKEQLKKLVKENFDRFISCKNTIDDIHLRLQQIEADSEGAGTGQLSQNIAAVDDLARRAFGPLLERQAAVERIRSVQGLLSRFRTLFNLPSVIRQHMKNGEYDSAVREYRRARSLHVPTQTGILRRVFEELEKLVAELAATLRARLEQPGTAEAEVAEAVRLLRELQPGADPVWDYLRVREARTCAVLEACVAEHAGRGAALAGRERERQQTETRWRQLQQDSSRGSSVDLVALLGQQVQEMGAAHAEEVAALHLRLVRQLSAALVRNIPAFWQLALSVFNGTFGVAGAVGEGGAASKVGSH